MNDKTLISELTVGEFKTLIQERMRAEIKAKPQPILTSEPTEVPEMLELPDDPSAPQHIRIQMLLKALENVPDDKSPEWWDEFDAFLAENRFKAQFTT